MAETRDRILAELQKEFDAIYTLKLALYDTTALERQYDAKITVWNRDHPHDTCRLFMVKATSRREEEARRAEQVRLAEAALLTAREDKKRAEARLIYAQAQAMLVRK